MTSESSNFAPKNEHDDHWGWRNQCRSCCLFSEPHGDMWCCCCWHNMEFQITEISGSQNYVQYSRLIMTDVPICNPGGYNEAALKALDLVLSEARNKRMKVVVTLADNWQEADSKKAVCSWYLTIDVNACCLSPAPWCSWERDDNQVNESIRRQAYSSIFLDTKCPLFY